MQSTPETPPLLTPDPAAASAARSSIPGDAARKAIYDSKTRPIMVTGYTCSGTTLLYRLLSGHSTVFRTIGEPKFFRHLPLIRKTHPNLQDPRNARVYLVYIHRVIQQGFLKSRDPRSCPPSVDLSEQDMDLILEGVGTHRDHQTLYAAVYDRLAVRAGKDCWLQKGLHAEAFARLLPRARVIQIVRDPRDVMASKKRRVIHLVTREDYATRRAERLTIQTYDPLLDTLSWRALLQATAQAIRAHPDRIRTIRYEDLVLEPERTTRSLCEFLGLAFEPAMLDVPPENPLDRDDASAPKRGFERAAIGRWQQALRGGEIALCQWLARRTMKQWGYEPARATVRGRIAGVFLPLRSAPELVHRLWKRYRSGGFSYLLNVLLVLARRLGVPAGKR